MIRALTLSLFFASGLALAEHSNWLRSDKTDKEIIYIVSTRPLADIYTHPLASNLTNNTSSYVYGLYLGLSNGTGTSSEQSLHTVSLDIQKMSPALIIVDDIISSSYLLKLLPQKFRDRTILISKSNLDLEQEDKHRRVKIESVAEEIVHLACKMNLFPESYYIFYDNTGLTANEASALKRNLTRLGAGSIKSFEIKTIQELDDLLFELNKNEKGVIISTVLSLVDEEFGQRIGLEEIKNTIRRRNTKHLEIGFNYLPETRNESIILELDYGHFIREYFVEKKKPKDIQIPFKVIINKRKLNRLGFKKNYIAALDDIDVLVE
jgi:hypothetical protein